MNFHQLFSFFSHFFLKLKFQYSFFFSLQNYSIFPDVLLTRIPNLFHSPFLPLMRALLCKLFGRVFSGYVIKVLSIDSSDMALHGCGYFCIIFFECNGVAMAKRSLVLCIQNRCTSSSLMESISVHYIIMPKKIKLKIAVIGDPKSGKTSFINNLLQKPFNPQYEKTDSFELSVYRFSRSQDYQIQLWECGSEYMKCNKHVRYAFFKNCSAAFLIFDLSDPSWKAKVSEWVSQAYSFDCFLVYGIGTKKEIFLREKFIQQCGQESVPEGKLSDSLLQNSGVETIDELEINQFFAEFQIKHFYQEATDKIHPSIKNAFIAIEDDQQKLTRSSLALGRRFDNSVVGQMSEREAQFLKSESARENHQFYSVREQFFEKLEK